MVFAFTHIFTKGFRVGMQMSGPPLWSGEGSKQPQVSALPERRVKKRKSDGTLGTFLKRQNRR